MSQDRGFDIIEGVLREHYGDAYKPQESAPRNGAGRDPDSDSPYDQINDLAMKDLDAWVPHLGIHKLRPQRGRYRSYIGVAQWRESSTAGRGLDERDLNLKITQSGIKDFGDGRTYTSLDLVMAARGCEVKEAFNWLDEKLGWSSGGPELDVEACRANKAKREEDEHVVEGPWPGSKAETPKADIGPDGKDRARPGNLLGAAWYFGDPAPEQLPMLVPFFIPARGFGYLGGQWGTFKTFVVNDLAVAIASGGKFAGQQVGGRGVVIQIELEGSNNEARMLAAAKARECQDERLPIVHLKKDPPKILTNGRANPHFREWVRQLAEFALAVAQQFDLPLALITIDPQNKVAGFKDEQSSGEGQIVSDAFSDLAKMAGCTVLVVDHFGKDPDAGLRGTSVKETSALFILNTSDQQKETHARRYLEIRKMRNGPSGIAVDFWMEDEEVSVQQLVKTETGVTTTETTMVKTLRVRWGEELRAASAASKRSKDEIGGVAGTALKHLNRMITENGTVLPEGCGAPRGLRGVLLEAWRQELITQRIIGGPNPNTNFGRIRSVLQGHSRIAIGDNFVWMPLL
jgi:AAA domain